MRLFGRQCSKPPLVPDLVGNTNGVETRHEVPHEGWGLRHQADEVARCVQQGLLESPVMPLDESISIMATMDAVRAQGAR